MNEPLIHNTDAHNLLNRVYEGMDVYDRDGHKVGSVSDVYAGAAADAPPGVEVGESRPQAAPGTGSIVNNVAEVFDDHLPEVLRSRLRHNGYIRIKAGLLKSDRFALREQVTTVDGERVTLNVSGEELIKG